MAKKNNNNGTKKKGRIPDWVKWTGALMAAGVVGHYTGRVFERHAPKWMKEGRLWPPKEGDEGYEEGVGELPEDNPTVLQSAIPPQYQGFLTPLPPAPPQISQQFFGGYGGAPAPPPYDPFGWMRGQQQPPPPPPEQNPPEDEEPPKKHFSKKDDELERVMSNYDDLDDGY